MFKALEGPLKCLISEINKDVFLSCTVDRKAPAVGLMEDAARKAGEYSRRIKAGRMAQEASVWSGVRGQR